MTKRWRLRVDPIGCEGRGLCTELLPELIRSDDWGFPVVADRDVPGELLAHARRAVAACPVLALRLVAATATPPPPPRPAPGGQGP